MVILVSRGMGQTTGPPPPPPREYGNAGAVPSRIMGTPPHPDIKVIWAQ